MTDTTVGVSKDSWALLNRMKDTGDTFDDTVKKMFNYVFAQDDEDFYYLDIPCGLIYFNCFSMDGEDILLKKETEVGRPFELSGEVDITHPNIPFQEIIDNTPYKEEYLEDMKMGVIEGTERMEERSGDLDPIFKVDSRFKILTIEEERVEVEDLLEEEKFWIELGDELVAVETYVFERTAFWGSGEHKHKVAVFRGTTPFYEPKES